MRALLLSVVALILFVLAALFASLNDQQLQLHYFWGQLDISLPLLLLLVFLLGAALVLLLAVVWSWRLRWQNFRLKAQLLKQERALHRSVSSISHEELPDGR